MQELVDLRRQSQRKHSVVHPAQTSGLRMGKEDIDRFIAEWSGDRHREGTTKRYRMALRKLYDWLPEDKLIRADTIGQWLDELANDGYSHSTLNYYGAVCNRWLKYMGAQEYRKKEKYDPSKTSQPAVTREEYHRMLDAAKDLRDERSFLLIKVFANTGIFVQDLGLLTVAAALAGEVRSGRRTIQLPPGLCGELLSYADFHGKPGMIFGTRTERVLQEARIAGSLKEVSQTAGLIEGRGTPHSLQKLYWNTRAEMESEGISDLDQAMNDRFEREQAVYGWGV